MCGFGGVSVVLYRTWVCALNGPGPSLPCRTDPTTKPNKQEEQERLEKERAEEERRRREEDAK